MAERAVLENFLNCHICQDIFKDPVSLGCNQSFCAACVSKFWEQAKNKNCPLCRRRSSKEQLWVNFTLGQLADSFAGRQVKAHGQEEEDDREMVCKKHPRDAVWFCLDKGRAVCPVCESPTKHSGHTVVPVAQAVWDMKQKLNTDLNTLQDKWDKYTGIKKNYQEILDYKKKMLAVTEAQMSQEFEKLHEFLRSEEEARITALREEEEEKKATINREMSAIQDKISNLAEILTVTKQDLEKSDLQFLKSHKPSHIRGLCSLEDPHVVPGVMTDVSKHLGNIKSKVWEKMREIVKYTPVVMDPNTAHYRLALSNDLTSMWWSSSSCELPDNPERNMHFTAVFGSEGLTEGRHAWVVEVGNHPHWVVGVAKESVDRKGECITSPKNGFWVLFHMRGKLTAAGNSICLNKKLLFVAVDLDYDRGEVTFYNPTDMSHIYTHRDTFTETLLPYFWVGKPINARDPGIIRIRSV